MDTALIFQHPTFKKFLLIILFYWLYLSGSSVVANEIINESSSNYLIELEGTWTDRVINREPVNSYDTGVVSLANLTGGTLYFRALLKGFDGALNLLEARRYLQLNYIWHYTLFTTTGQTTVTIPKIGRLTTEQLSGLRNELRNRGFFDWRSWSYFPVWTGEWRMEIEVVKPAGIALKCGDQIGRCEFKIMVVQ